MQTSWNQSSRDVNDWKSGPDNGSEQLKCKEFVKLDACPFCAA